MHYSNNQEKVKCRIISSWTLIIIGIGLLTLAMIFVQGQWLTTLTTFKNYISISSGSDSQTLCSGNSKNSDEICQWYFLNYTPSSWEKFWFTNIEEFQNNVCERIADEKNLNKAILTVERLMELQKLGRNCTGSDKQQADELLSKMFYRQECVNPLTNVSFQEAEVSQVIEPLIGLLRDPLTICNRINSLPASAYKEAGVQSKRFFLLSVSAPFYIHPLSQNHKDTLQINIQSNKRNMNLPPWMYQRSKLNLLDMEFDLDTRNGQNILIDLGSSYFGSWGGDTSAAAGRWFYEYYKRFGVKFDRIIAYEHFPLNSKTVWNQLPDDVFSVYTLINVGCAASGKFNPWIMLKAMAKPHDHVVIKLDIDTPAIEIPLINQLLNDSTINSLVDELFFEHHITVREMRPYWGSPPGTLRDSYVLFTKLRQLGIRMHSWP
ncbi:unnamed protein product [Rotaria sordida]|uniref:Uncharacterized protein n=1 Tax=Rotaria sordida TaxID=392033 RepID=A0A815JNS7_9BILA|nr:unnamed protein product [Rotaria sordida]CAF1321802.1 unnamed protein product [Rotaria sordida]CAF1383831.1 unnamed protein product [Rotaria sordida]CAF1455766.1 unnamed protein product [Rotaria sordida]CAF1617212.1 unnamed protein product [Rotaria sordida]